MYCDNLISLEAKAIEREEEGGGGEREREKKKKEREKRRTIEKDRAEKFVLTLL